MKPDRNYSGFAPVHKRQLYYEVAGAGHPVLFILLSALIPVAAGLSGFDYQPDACEKTKREFEIFTHMDELWEHKAFDELADLEAHVWVDGPAQPLGRADVKIHQYIHDIVLANYTRQDGKATAQPLTPPAAGRLGEIHVPNLFLVGDYDETVTLAMADKLETDIPRAVKLIFPRTAHMLPLEQPDMFNDVVLDFLRKIEIA